ncbi:MAG: quinone-dependent dihydroorotate dehydrogenase, partial [Deltaproteobacteria bacterium]|nr:quinone-dependent dihydroorotate dehydrogenase [Deltaproteobacteria bacterium]
PWLWRALTWALRQLPAEFAHQAALWLLALAGRIHIARLWLAHSLPPPPPMPLRLGDLTFVNRVGLAAGYDKNAVALEGLALLGFGHIEVGTVTPLPQPGNPRPRVFRRLAAGALVNRMGFPSDGARAVARRLERYRRDHPLGSPPLLAVNLGKNKQTPLDQAAADYALAATLLAPYADLLVLNVSSPNTPDLRALQTVEHLQALLEATRAAARSAAARSVPVWVKLAPDMESADLARLVQHLPADALVLTNTTVSRPVDLGAAGDEAGGLSGMPLAPLALQVQKLVVQSGCVLPLVASGGVVSAERAVERLQAGASLVQVWTGLVLRGPALVGQVGRALAAARGEHV